MQGIAECETVCGHNINIYIKGLFKPMGLIFICINMNMCMCIPRLWVLYVQGIVTCRYVTELWLANSMAVFQ